MPPIPVNDANSSMEATLTITTGPHWLRVEVRDANGSLQSVNSPLYVNFSGQSTESGDSLFIVK